jgi:NhaA family Na+:H+ antiporter
MATHARSGDHPPASMLREFLDNSASGGLVLMAAAALALIVANSPLAPTYFGALGAYLGPLSVLHWINDALMAVFFLLVGLEIKREVLDGQLSTWSRRVLPGVAAAGGMVFPALIFAAFNWNDPTTIRGWAIPAATDIAFALGVLALLGSRVPTSLKVFLTALAIIDDLGAVAIIAVFYTGDLSPLNLGLAAAVVVVLVAMNRFGVTRLLPYCCWVRCSGISSCARACTPPSPGWRWPSPSRSIPHRPGWTTWRVRRCTGSSTGCTTGSLS